MDVMDLSQAEAVADIIHARSNFSLEVARKQLAGSIGQENVAICRIDYWISLRK